MVYSPFLLGQLLNPKLCHFLMIILPTFFYRSAQEAQTTIDKALSRGQVMPSEERFDSNCITPGTEFMWKLQKQLKYFVHKKTTTDPLWQQVKVVLSGQDVRLLVEALEINF